MSDEIKRMRVYIDRVKNQPDPNKMACKIRGGEMNKPIDWGNVFKAEDRGLKWKR
jgi:hypothetical protein